MIRGLITTIIIIALGACAMGAIVTISEPYVEPSAEIMLDDRGVLRRDQITISMVPENGYGNVGGIGIVVPVVPLPGSAEPYRIEKPFQVEVRFDPQVEGYTYIPSETELYYKDSVFTPKRSTNLITQTFETGGEGSYEPGHSWSCRRPITGFETLDSTRSVSLSKGCVGIEFPVNTIHPDNSFTLLLRGVRFQDKAVELPAVSFRKSTRGAYMLMGGQ
jgi:hypothetical protein